MRVVHIEGGRHLYGGARQVLYLIDGLRREGVDNVLVCPRGSEIAGAAAERLAPRDPEAARPQAAGLAEPQAEEFADTSQDGGREVLERGARERALGGRCEIVELPFRGDLDIGAIGRLRRVLAEHDPDLVHVHSRRGVELFASLASRAARRRLVLTRRVDDREWAPWARLKYQPYSAVIAISRAVETELVEHVGLPRSRVHLVPSGVDTHLYRPDDGARARLRTALGLPHDRLVAGVVAQLIPRKGHDVLLAALPEVLARHPAFHVVFLGRGPLEPELRAAIERRGLGDRILLAGFRTDLPRLLPGVDFVLHPARGEGLGLALLEAMSAGVAVAASAVGGIVDVIEDETSGLLVPPDEPRAWAAAVDRLIRDPDLCARLGAAGRRRVESAFSARRMVAGNVAVYRQLLGSGVAAARGAGGDTLLRADAARMIPPEAR